MSTPDPPIAAPAFCQLLREARAPLEMAAFWLHANAIDALRRGDGHPVMFLPAFAMGDEGLRPMAQAIERLGYATCGWEQGRNLGLRSRVMHRVLERVDALRTRHAMRVSLVGWSAGGLYARQIAAVRPEWVRRVITLGAPIHAHGSGQRHVERFKQLFESVLAELGRPSFSPNPEAPPVPCTAIHSKSDGVVAWRAALEAPAPHTENIEVEGSHLGLGFNREVLRIVADRLALPDDVGEPEKPPAKHR